MIRRHKYSLRSLLVPLALCLLLARAEAQTYRGSYADLSPVERANVVQAQRAASQNPITRANEAYYRQRAGGSAYPVGTLEVPPPPPPAPVRPQAPIASPETARPVVPVVRRDVTPSAETTSASSTSPTPSVGNPESITKEVGEASKNVKGAGDSLKSKQEALKASLQDALKRHERAPQLDEIEEAQRVRYLEELLRMNRDLGNDLLNKVHGPT